MNVFRKQSGKSSEIHIESGSGQVSRLTVKESLELSQAILRAVFDGDAAAISSTSLGDAFDMGRSDGRAYVHRVVEQSGLLRHAPLDIANLYREHFKHELQEQNRITPVATQAVSH